MAAVETVTIPSASSALGVGRCLQNFAYLQVGAPAHCTEREALVGDPDNTQSSAVLGVHACAY